MHLLPLLFLLDQVAAVTAVSSCVNMRDTDGRLTENCKAADLRDLPAGLDPQTKVLLFPDNLFTAVTWSSFQRFSEIYHIDLTGNKIPEVTPSGPPLLPTLSILRLGSNLLTSLPDHSFSACPALTELYLDNNRIHSLSDQTFSGLHKLEVLDLSSNRIQVLPQLMLRPLQRIETLFIEKNEIKLMPHSWFSPKEEVLYLFVSANPWDCTCPNLYLKEYLYDYESNFYTREGPIFKVTPEKVICGSPAWHKDKPMMDLENTDLCPPEVNPRGDFLKPEDPPTTTPTNAPTSTSMMLTVTNSTEWFTYAEWFATYKETYDREEVVSRATFLTVRPRTGGPAHQKTTPQATRAGATTSLPTTLSPTTSWVQEAPQATTPPTTMPPTTMPPTTTPPTTTPPTTTPPTTMPPTTMPPTTMPSTTMPAITTPVLATTPATRAPTRLKSSTVRGAGVFCFWLFAGLLLLCFASAACTLLTLWRLLIWYKRVYRPLSKGLRLLTYSEGGKKETPGGGGGGVLALYRSVLYIHREEGEVAEKGETAQEGVKGETDQLPVTLKPTEEGGAGGGGEGMYRKTLHRLISREAEIDGWRDVVEECRVPVEGGGRRGGGQDGGASRGRCGGASRKRYSVILREEKEGAGQEREGLDWVVGGWEVKGGAEGGAESRSSWGEWLENYLPRMPWAVIAPTEGEVPQ